jgi:hypothetical protein
MVRQVRLAGRAGRDPVAIEGRAKTAVERRVRSAIATRRHHAAAGVANW